jgi:hypothetical protein
MQKTLISILTSYVIHLMLPVSVQSIPLLAQSRSSSSEVAYLNGVWEGSYTCGQGLTKLKVLIDAKSKTNINAVFMFSSHPQNPGVPSGRFRMKGFLQTFNSPDMPDLLDLKGTEWINKPAPWKGSIEWRVVDLRGDISTSRGEITGNVPQAGCGTFELVKNESS